MLTEEKRKRAQALSDEMDRARAWVKIEVHLVSGITGRPATMSEERVFLGSVPPPSIEAAQKAAAWEAVNGLREMAASLERQLIATYG